MSSKKVEQTNESSKSGFLSDPKHRSYLYTGLFFVAVLFFFVVNNTNGEPEEGPYPPNYSTVNSSDLLNLSLSDLLLIHC